MLLTGRSRGRPSAISTPSVRADFRPEPSTVGIDGNKEAGSAVDCTLDGTVSRTDCAHGNHELLTEERDIWELVTQGLAVDEGCTSMSGPDAPQSSEELDTVRHMYDDDTLQYSFDGAGRHYESSTLSRECHHDYHVTDDFSCLLNDTLSASGHKHDDLDKWYFSSVFCSSSDSATSMLSSASTCRSLLEC